MSSLATDEADGYSTSNESSPVAGALHDQYVQQSGDPHRSSTPGTITVRIGVHSDALPLRLGPGYLGDKATFWWCHFIYQHLSCHYRRSFDLLSLDFVGFHSPTSQSPDQSQRDCFCALGDLGFAKSVPHQTGYKEVRQFTSVNDFS